MVADGEPVALTAEPAMAGRQDRLAASLGRGWFTLRRPGFTDVFMSESSSNRKPRHRGIYLLPNLFTTGAMFAGFYAIVTAIDGHFTEAAMAVVVAAVLDGMDGRVARMTGTQTEFGVQYDSLSDLLNFGLAPSLVLYSWSLSSLQTWGAAWGKFGWTAAFVYAACAALRLARFNTQVAVVDKRYFQGLSSTAAAMTTMAYVWTMDRLGVDRASLAMPTAVITIVIGLLMVSRLRYYSFKSLPGGEGQSGIPFLWVIASVLILVLLAIDPPKVLLGLFALYVLSGPLLTLWGRLALRRRPRRRG